MANNTGKKAGGRQKGTPNKTTASVKEALQKAFKELGGIKALTEWAKDEPTEFYKLYCKLLPKELEVSGKDGATLPTNINIVLVEANKNDC